VGVSVSGGRVGTRSRPTRRNRELARCGIEGLRARGAWSRPEPSRPVNFCGIQPPTVLPVSSKARIISTVPVRRHRLPRSSEGSNSDLTPQSELYHPRLARHRCRRPGARAHVHASCSVTCAASTRPIFAPAHRHRDHGHVHQRQPSRAHQDNAANTGVVRRYSGLSLWSEYRVNENFSVTAEEAIRRSSIQGYCFPKARSVGR